MSSRCAFSSDLLSCTEDLFPVTDYTCPLSWQEQDMLAYVTACKKGRATDPDCFPEVLSNKMSGPQDSFKLCKYLTFLSNALSI